MANGSIGYIVGNSPGFTLKIGLLDSDQNMNMSDAFKEPYFAYIKTKYGSTAQAQHTGNLSDTAGYKMWTYYMDEQSLPILKDIFEDDSVSLFFNRTPNGLDVEVPLDLTVIKSESINGVIQRKNSREELRKFTACALEISEKLTNLNKETR
jgi:hypothetical protein